MADSFSFSSTPDSSNYNVYLGIWTNWSRGPVFGATLTLNRKPGTLLISFTALFVTIVASRFWRIACSILHRKLSTTEYRDVLHHQRQAIFRNSSSSESGLWSLMQISWAWRHLAQKNITRTLPHIIFAVTCLVAFSLASGFSSSISTAIRDEVLIVGNCGQIYRDNLTEQDLRLIVSPWESSIISNAAGYAQQVYSPNRTGILGNGAFVKKTLNTISDNTASCPFEDSVCRSTESNLLLNTEYINICDDLGVNLRQDECILFRYVVHCAPLVTEGRSEPTTFKGISNYTGYKYGPLLPQNADLEHADYTIMVQDTYSQNIPMTNRVKSSGYVVYAVSSLTIHRASGPGTFLPESDLRRPDADIDLFFLSGNGVYSSQPVNDPWYRSNVLSNLTYDSLVTDSNWTLHPTKVYQPVDAASPHGCATQNQICKGAVATNNSCGPLASYNDAWSGAVSLFGIDPNDVYNYDTQEQLIEAYSSNNEASRFLWLSTALQNYPSYLASIITTLGSHSLAFDRSLRSGIQGQLPYDQWKLDVGNWWNISLSLLQESLVNTANGPVEPALERIKIAKISTSYISFSLFGLYLTYITGFLVILLSFALEPILSCAQRRWKNREYENLEWISNETLQLQRLAYEESGQGDWSKCLDSIPITLADQELGPLNLSDPEHPMLHHSRSPRSSKENPGLSSLHDASTEVVTDQGDGEIQEEGQRQDSGLQRDEEHQDQQVSPRSLSLRSAEEPQLGYEEQLSADHTATSHSHPSRL
ncbi:hypothetical protein FHL15_002181 [Xylaria flabelliformis]|uniref:Uncharacterized protein n=1 Tax=Xylaria flabelliformis TaxID=2512241 RepID=A0A553I9J0_9PEZI|nr:hypothetical protein FHL15_002181 [Xylaria flabelliformis]